MVRASASASSEASNSPHKRIDHHAMQAAAQIVATVFQAVQSDGDDVGHLDQPGRPAQTIAAMRAAGAVEQTLTRQRLKQRLQRTAGHSGAFGQFGRIHNGFAAAVEGDIQDNSQSHHSTISTRKKHLPCFAACHLSINSLRPAG